MVSLTLAQECCREICAANLDVPCWESADEWKPCPTCEAVSAWVEGKLEQAA